MSVFHVWLWQQHGLWRWFSLYVKTLLACDLFVLALRWISTFSSSVTIWRGRILMVISHVNFETTQSHGAFTCQYCLKVTGIIRPTSSSTNSLSSVYKLLCEKDSVGKNFCVQRPICVQTSVCKNWLCVKTALCKGFSVSKTLCAISRLLSAKAFVCKKLCFKTFVCKRVCKGFCVKTALCEEYKTLVCILKFLPLKVSVPKLPWVQELRRNPIPKRLLQRFSTKWRSAHAKKWTKKSDLEASVATLSLCWKCVCVWKTLCARLCV